MNHDPAPNPIYLAEVAYRGDLAVARLLLDAGADVNAHGPVTATRMTPLQAACFHGSLAMATLLLDRGADPNRTSPYPHLTDAPLYSCVQFERESLAELLLSRGAAADWVAADGRFVLGLALAKGYGKLARDLIAAGAPLERLHVSGTGADVVRGTPLFLAIQHDDGQSVQALLNAGVDPNARENGQVPALIRAVRGGKVAACRALLAGGVDMDARGPDRRSALSWAAKAGTPEDIRSMLRAQGARAAAQRKLTAGSTP